MAVAELLKIDRTAVEWRQVDDEIVALDLRDSMYLGINASGTVLWPLLAEGATRHELVSALVETYEIDEAQAAGDVDAFVTSLRDRELLEAPTP